ncbi:MAG: hypothetical protein A2887_00945 [Alphaproteobacteria bacterium RIFCSPLOWO2_01_FULL_40_26]|nr:MAG: hypothetical protein A3D15_04650 [Alphaproteobacteria bacterium RIFCSPHIGHO2_02_FULL_40_34]OFW88630.1 MAG: hypothetical protein A2794_04970 [Alphaproteobacteria bacterium RIFCSPHIGHO2_01_FULL_40_8]OFW95465.1 MAG: hypothetical protein A2887_00945 [Alphaproteobacteria bacterium RIFCSPLOWO2_01_FULL_40_26]OFX10271.1 MAG: hypothetical protein A3H30_00925 [Alphaproteobacteria bacterium RIFCSPLOWO2_02_FULL_40_19]OFX11523.1 MAG: hypothetical protein A3G22_04805 [Alphaproteobacteria bacterium RI
MSVQQITVQDAFELLKQDQNSALVDVRTFEEFNFVGFVNPSEFTNRLVLLPWQLYPEMQENPEFANNLESSLKEIFGNVDKETKLLFMCRTGGRSNEAANFASNCGYKNCYNIISGFEGSLNNHGQRGKIDGWKACGLPWRQK